MLDTLCPAPPESIYVRSDYQYWCLNESNDHERRQDTGVSVTISESDEDCEGEVDIEGYSYSPISAARVE